MRVRWAVALVLAAAALAGPPAVRRGVLRVPFWVDDSEAPLAADSVMVTVNGANAEIMKLLGPKDDLVLLLVLDLAGDMMQAESAKESVKALARGLPDNVLVGLLRAQDGLQVLLDPTADRAALAAAIDAQPVSGKAGLLESVRPVAELGDAIQAKASVRVAALFLTDSDVRNYREDFTNPVVNWSDSGDVSRRFRDGLVREKISKLDVALARMETPIFVLHLVYLTDSLNQAYQTGLMTLTTTTGGTSYFCRSRSEVDDNASAVFDAILSQYVVTVPLEGKRAKTVEVGLESPGHTLRGRVRYAVGD